MSTIVFGKLIVSALFGSISIGASVAALEMALSKYSDAATKLTGVPIMLIVSAVFGAIVYGVWQ